MHRLKLGQKLLMRNPFPLSLRNPLQGFFEGRSGIELGFVVPYFSFLGSQSMESAFIFSALRAVFNPPRTLVKV